MAEYHSLGVTSPATTPMAKGDPFYVVKEKVQTLMVKMRSEYDTWRDMLGRNTAEEPNFDSLHASLKLSVKTAKSDLNDLDQTIAIVEQNRVKFRNITDSELMGRKRFVSEMKTQVDGIETTIESSKTKAKIEKDRAVALVAPRGGSTVSPRGASLADRAGSSANDDAIEGESMEMKQLERKQDDALDGMQEALGRLGAMAGSIHKELKEHTELIDELDVSVTEADDNMKIAIKRLDRLLGKSDMPKYCCIFILFAIVIALFFIVVWG